MGIFIMPGVVALAVLVGAYIWGGTQTLLLVALLAVLETTLSFDNAVVNARVLKRMSPVWQRRFLLWGIPVAVVGVRFVLPLIIVAVAAHLSPLFVAGLALFDPVRYGMYLQTARIAIASFGSAFLFLVSFKYFFDEAKTLHWIGFIESHLARWGGIAAIEVALTTLVVIFTSLFARGASAEVAIAGALGIVSFIAIESIAESFEVETSAAAGLALFVYLNVLDSAFSLDEVIAAFAFTSNVVVIAAGLGIGALFVRAFTVALVRAKTLDELPYLEHGAHYAIFGLALAMLIGIFVHVPEAITGLIGLVIIIFAYLSSRRETRQYN